MDLFLGRDPHRRTPGDLAVVLDDACVVPGFGVVLRNVFPFKSACKLAFMDTGRMWVL